MKKQVPTSHHDLATDEIARRAFTLIGQYRVDPTPLNYSIWFEYVRGANTGLVREIETIIEQKAEFTENTCDYLYRHYLADPVSREAMTEAATGAKTLLADALKMMREFSEHTEDYNKELDTHIEKLSKGFDNPIVGDLIKDMVESATAMKEKSKELDQRIASSEQEIEHLKLDLAQATTDSLRDFLTGIGNRRWFDQQLEEHMARAKENGEDLCLLMVDVDHFKKFNDTYGHMIGDEVLKVVAKSLTETLKGKDIIARYGGEEFAVLLPATPLGGAMIAAENIRKSIAEKELKNRGTGQKYGVVTVSIGVAYFHTGRDSVPTFLHRADEALYRSKSAGRNRVTQETLVAQ